LEQARALDEMLASEGHQVDFVIALDVPEDVLVERILHRAAIEGRSDDTREAIAERMREYHKLTEAVLDYYRRHGVRVIEVNGMGDPDEVFERIRGAIGISSR
jgi:adenylate kinase